MSKWHLIVKQYESHVKNWNKTIHSSTPFDIKFYFCMFEVESHLGLAIFSVESILFGLAKTHEHIMSSSPAMKWS